MFLGPSLSLKSQTPKGTPEGLTGSTGGQNYPHPCPGPCLLPAAWTGWRCTQLRCAWRVGWEEEQDLPCLSQTHFKPQLPGFSCSCALSGIMYPPHPPCSHRLRGSWGQRQNKMSGALLRVEMMPVIFVLSFWYLGLASKGYWYRMCTLRRMGDCHPYPEVCW